MVISKQNVEVIEVLKRETSLKQSSCYLYGKDWDLDILSPYPSPNLKGEHQRINAATALKAISLCFPLKPEAISKGLQSTEWPGRLQCLKEGKHEIWIDGAHNSGGAEALAKELRKWESDKPIIGIIAMKERKDAERFIKILKPCFNEVFFIPLTENNKTGKSYSPDDLLTIAEKEGMSASKAENYQDALAKIQKKHPQSRIMVTGSLFLVGEILGLSS